MDNRTLDTASKEELKVIAEIYSVEMSKPPYNESWSSKKALDKMKFYSKYYDLYTIKDGKEIVGFIVINPKFMCPGEVAFGEELVIRSDMQNKGIGGWTLNKIFEIYKNKGFKRFLGILDINSRAKNLYNRVGLRQSTKDILIERWFK